MFAFINILASKHLVNLQGFTRTKKKKITNKFKTHEKRNLINLKV